MTWTVHIGDCRAVLASLPPNSIDSIVTDPPYELGFMGKKWDSSGVAFDVATWAACLRVLKPGGHLLAFGGTRTSHRMVCAIEDAGFDIRDGMGWVYLTGFPKSLDVSKAIDKARTEDREPVRVVCRAVRAAMDSRRLASKDLTKHFGDCHPRLVDHWAARDTDSQPSLPTWEQWQTLRDVLGMGNALDADVWRLNQRKGTLGENWEQREVVGTAVLPDTTKMTLAAPLAAQGVGAVPTRTVNLTKASTEGAVKWQGWGTALKPAIEPICMARKPLDGTVAANVLKHGTGALNIGACRVGGEGGGTHCTNRDAAGACQGHQNAGRSTSGETFHGPDTSGGRWPANVLLHEDVDMPDLKRVFYVAKPSTREREAGFDALPILGEVGTRKTSGAEMVNRKEGSAGLNSPRAGGGAKSVEGRGNTHATVKPLSLMRELVRLVTPQGGTVLDPFTGSGTTGCAAVVEGFHFTGVELEEGHAFIAGRRIKHWEDNGAEPNHETP